MKEAMLYKQLDANRVCCNLCAHRCLIEDGKRGSCGVRLNQNGNLYSLVYGRMNCMAIDPVEKKPLFHFYPGTSTFSIATVGCNFTCRFCQNADISQWARKTDKIGGRDISPEFVVREAQRWKTRSIAYTYTEPTIYTEYAYDIAVLAHQAGIANIYVTNGYMTSEMLDEFYPYLDAANVDIKSFRNDYYRKICGSQLQPVLDSIKKMIQQGVWTEITTLVVPGENDSNDELGDIARFIAEELGHQVPWHIYRYYPHHQMLDRPPTPMDTLYRARDIGRIAGLRYVYIGNCPDAKGEDTFCPGCGQPVIQRYGFRTLNYKIERGCCAECGTSIDGILPNRDA